MRKLLLGLVGAACLLASPSFADWTGKDATGNVITFKNANVCTSVVCVPISEPVDSTGAAFGVTGNPFFIGFGTGVTLPAFAATPTVKIDQTTPGTTNGVFVTNANANGAAAPASASPVTPSNQPVGGGTIVTNQVSVGTTVGGTQIIAARTGVAGTGRISATVCNTSTTDVWVGASGLTTATGQLLVGIKGACITLNTTAAIFGIVGAGTETVSFSETF